MVMVILGCGNFRDWSFSAWQSLATSSPASGHRRW